MINYPLIGFIVVLIESIGILLAEKRTSFYLTIATILTIIVFFLS